MIKLLIVADDFTGALDTGVQFASCGAVTKVITREDYKMEVVDESVEVLVINAETRHMTADDAYGTTYNIIKRAYEKGIPHIMKKTDSALRGNIGSELSAVLDATGEKVLHFIPALPKMNRVTRKGIHFIDGIKVSDSVFGTDPFEPVLDSYIPDIISGQSNKAVVVLEREAGNEMVDSPSIYVYDAETEGDIRCIADSIYEKDKLRVFAGCAGLASVLPDLLGLKGKSVHYCNKIEKLLILCGSVNPITGKQLDYAEARGIKRIRLKPHQKLSKEYYDTSCGKRDIEELVKMLSSSAVGIIDSNDPSGEMTTREYARENGMSLDDIRVNISSTLGFILKRLFEAGIESTVLITGGDMLLGFMKQMDIWELSPVCEMAPGTVMSRMTVNGREYEIISKSGGFGDENLFMELADKYMKKPDKRRKNIEKI
ncbi:Uncharacterized conserved protein YgbK, DUF1537 family [Dethiosulfatibacter aminovorans DSM 17477]|uniref:Uncharacterized conserved protein YgbK, DUF1537 family n=1 Tax=Dethiosulfatibacter aminovorans DSM 17477 TaxID=1121476 RepID=A0A1M6C656_9FIRM|nr:four-carbon acid sugar kinase family protein [Dethiosulfatibacter aminovorans]SHI56413.1 Uncharacterized conserved protein YgbK, DUF1537 family [Dethiosulfatibacter aminovorans DSM 17477]